MAVLVATAASILVLGVSLLISSAKTPHGAVALTSAAAHSTSKNGACERSYQKCLAAPRSDQQHCENVWYVCVIKKCDKESIKSIARCPNDPDCTSACTQEATSNGGLLSCCSDGPRRNNSCRRKIDGACDPKITNLSVKPVGVFGNVDTAHALNPYLDYPNPYNSLPHSDAAFLDAVYRPPVEDSTREIAQSAVMFNPNSLTNLGGEVRPGMWDHTIAGGPSLTRVPAPAVFNPHIPVMADAFGMPLPDADLKSGSAEYSVPPASEHTFSPMSLQQTSQTQQGFWSRIKQLLANF
jgi:hypothetical protein